MRVLKADFDMKSFEARIARAAHRVLMLDYDGTLAPFNIRPDLAVPYPEVTEALRAIANAGRTRVVIVSGRPADEVPPLLALEPRPEIWGSHGRERLLPQGERTVAGPDPKALEALDNAARAVVGAEVHGARIERKLASVALHWRGLADDVVAHVRSDARTRWEAQVHDHGLELLPFDGGLELRVRGHTKANAVHAVLSETGQDSAVAYLGDDITDEDAFIAVKPRGIAVLVRSEPRETSADLWLRPPQELASFLQLWT